MIKYLKDSLQYQLVCEKCNRFFAPVSSWYEADKQRRDNKWFQIINGHLNWTYRDVCDQCAKKYTIKEIV